MRLTWTTVYIGKRIWIEIWNAERAIGSNTSIARCSDECYIVMSGYRGRPEKGLRRGLRYRDREAKASEQVLALHKLLVGNNRRTDALRDKIFPAAALSAKGYSFNT